jgi:hypothetical protein
MLSKFYSLDECYQKEKVFDYLEELQNEELIVFDIIDSDMIKIKDIGLSEKQTKDIVSFFDEMDVIDYSDYDDEFNGDDDDYDDYDDYQANDDYF